MEGGKVGMLTHVVVVGVEDEGAGYREGGTDINLVLSKWVARDV
jgi:hypothetical protein